MTNDQDPYIPVREALSSFRGSWCEHLGLSITGSVDALEISLIPSRPNDGLNLSVRGIHYFAVDRTPHEDMSFLDFTATTLLPSTPWPQGFPGQFSGPKPTHPLLWLHAEGAATFDIVAAIVVALEQAH